MEDQVKKNYFIGIHERDGIAVGHEFRLVEPKLVSSNETVTSQTAPSQTQKDDGLIPDPDEATFSGVILSFVSVMGTYRDFVSLMLTIGPALSVALAAKTIGDFAKQNGVERPDLAREGRRYYELSMASYREFTVHNDRVQSGLAGASHLPEVMVMGLISAYDAYLSRLLSVVINLHEEVVLTSEKNIKFSELASFGTIEAARKVLISREVESVIRSSHHEQFTWMENHFGLKLRVELPIWPVFIEVCERRNLITHTGGVVSQQYIQNCQDNGIKTGLPELGKKLNTDIDYFRNAVQAVHEIGIKLGHVLWRKFSAGEQKQADIELNEHCLNLIIFREYQLAEKLLTFAVKTIRNHPFDVSRRMMIINLANAVRLQDRQEEAIKILDGEDWSASAPEFSICVAAVRGDMDKLIKLMRASPEAIKLEDYRSWPVFRGLDAKFIAAFEELFEEPFTVVIPPVQQISASDSILDSQALN